jgi:gluconokinase
VLREAGCGVRFLQLEGDRALVAERIGARKGHYMPPSLLDSQLAALEPLGPDEDGATVPVAGAPDEVCEAALSALGLAGRAARS